MIQRINPALTPEEWQHEIVSLGREGVFLQRGDGLELWFEGDMVSVDPPMAGRVAAFCLHDQPFGFTWEHVDQLGSESRRETSHKILWMERLADLIEALLPPRETKA